MCIRDSDRGLHGNADGRNVADSAGNPREWGQMSQEYHRDGNRSCENPAGMEFIFAGSTQTIKIPVQSLEYKADVL